MLQGMTMSTTQAPDYSSAVRAMSQAAAESELTHAPVRLEGDQAECCEAAQRFADRGAADVEALGEQLLAKHGPGPTFRSIMRSSTRG